MENLDSKTSQVNDGAKPPVPLDYFPPPRRQRRGPVERFNDWLARIPTDPLLKRWWWRRGTYYGMLGLLFIAVAFYFGPNVLLFGKLTRPSPADFVALTQRPSNLAAVRAMKEFKRDHGRWPKELDELVPKYLPDAKLIAGNVLPGEYVTWGGRFEHVITYRFTPGSEGWWVRGPLANGRIPAPIVTISPAARPATRPNP